MAGRQRADVALVERGLYESRARAQEAIRAGLVRVDGVALRRPSDPLATDAVVIAEPVHPWVSRGGVKLAHALDAFGLDPAGRIALDVGASTGGFTEVLLARGARRVYAVDVGHGQLHPRLHGHPALVAIEGTDARDLDGARIPEPVGFLTIDVSFVPLGRVLPAIVPLMAPGADLVALVKPQFEAGPAFVGKGGIVRDPAVHARVCAEVVGLLRDLGLAVREPIPSPITGGDGNREFLATGRRPA